MYTYCACTVTHVRLQFPLEHPICNPLNEETRVCCHGIVASTKFSKLQLQNRRLFGWGGQSSHASRGQMSERVQLVPQKQKGGRNDKGNSKKIILSRRQYPRSCK
jgi:hypothetical protein